MDVRVKSRFGPLWLLALTVLLTGFLWGMTPMVARAEDNSSTVPGNPTYTEDAFYYSDQYMWKVSLFVAKSDTVNKDSSNMNEFYRIGNQAVYLTPVSNWNGWAAGSRPSNISGLFFSKENKVDTLMELQSKGGDVNALDPVQLASGNGVYILNPVNKPPYVPQLSDGDIYDNGVIYGDSVGNITKVANYFNSSSVMDELLNFYASKQGMNPEGLIQGLELTIDGETRTGWNPNGILPDALNDNPTNQVEWLIVYEPVSIVYVKDTAHPGSYYGYALSATDFAVSQIKHQMDWRYDETRWTAWAGQQADAWKPNANRQHVSRLAFLLMGNSVITSSNWYGLAAGSGVDQNAAIPFNRWFSDQQTKYGGWGMTRWIKPAEYNKPRDNDYRPNTDVILSTPVYSNINATPGSELTVTYKINGEVIGTDSLVAPMKTESYSYLKWHTPDVSTVTNYDLEMSISPYPEGTINCGGNEYTHRTLTIRPLEESTPPDPKVGDTMPTDLPANLVPPTSVPGEDTADETVAPVIKSVKAVTEAPYYKNETVKIEVVTNRATKNLTFTNTDSGVGKQFGSDSLGDGMLISRSVNELSNEIVWTIEFVPANLGTNHYAFKSLNAAAGESEVYAFDVEVVVDPDLPVIYDVLINPVQAVYTLYEEVVKTPLTYEVYFNTNGGNEMGAQSAEYNTLLTEPGQPTREGYSFIGWFKDPGFAYPWNFESDRIMGVTTLYAKWEINTYFVHFDPQGGSDTFSPITAEYGANIEEPAPIPTRSNYVFLGWYKDIGCNTPWNFTEDTITGDTTLFGKWDATALTVTFDSQGGSVVGSISADYNMMITSPSDPFKPGFTFKGWYQEAACNTVWTFASDRVQSDLTLFAKWDVNLYTVSFDSLGGSAVPAQTAQNESITTKPVDPIRSGYSFGGWFKEDACITPWDFGVDTVTRDTTLFALWTADEAAIEFVTNNGTDVPKMVGATDREILDTSMPITVRDGYTFNGWFATADFSGDVITALPDKYPMGTTIYYAKWTADPAFIEFVTNGGSDVATMTGVTDQAIAPTTMPATSRAGYTFSGWFAEADFSGTEVTALPGQYPIGTTTYYAKWTPIKYTVSFDSQGGSAVLAQQIEYDTCATTPESPSRDGFVFKGWFKESQCTNAWNFGTEKITGDVTIFAKWEEGLPGPDVPLEYWSWNQINKIAELGLGESYFDVGEEKNITLSTGEVLTLQIYGFNHDQLADGTSNKTNITFGLKNLMATTRQINSTDTNYLSWDGCIMRTWLDDELYVQLPANLAPIIQTVFKTTTKGSASYILENSTDKLFLFSEYELLGQSINAYANEGYKYPIFTDNNSRRKKLSNGDGDLYWYWTRSPQTFTNNYFCAIYISGGSGYYGNPSPANPLGVCFGFAIGNAPTNSYTISYDSNGGSTVSSTTAILNTKITEPTKPTKENAIFDGWYKDAGFVSKWDFAVDKITGATTLYAKWSSLPAVGTPLADCSWDQIAAVANAGLGDVYWDVGAEKDMTLSTGEIVTMQICGFDHDDRSDGLGKANITFASKNLLQETRQMYVSMTNPGWSPTLIRSWANSTLMTEFPSEVQNNLSTVSKKSGCGTYPGLSLETTQDKVFLFSQFEMTGNSTNTVAGEGSQYELFVDSNNRIKKLGGESGTLYPYWLRSRWGTYGSYSAITSSYSGYPYAEAGNSINYEANGNIGVCFGFSMGKATDMPPVGTALKDCSWQQIANIANAGKGDDFWNIGDTKDMTLTAGEVVSLEIYDFNHDDKSDGSGKTNITFGTKNLLSSMTTMNNTSTNAVGWSGSGLRTWTNGILLSRIPSDIQNEIKLVNKYTTAGYYSHDVITTSDKIFVLSEIEQFGVLKYSLPGEGSLYPIFTSDDSRIKKLSNGSGAAWFYWGRSPTLTNNGYSCVSFFGLPSYNASDGGIGVNFAFCMGNAPEYSVSFDSQGGSAVISKTVGANLTTIAPATPTKSGMTFAGWFKDAAGTTEWNFTTDIITGPTTLYAKWITLPAIGTSLEACSWDQIAYISKAGLADTYFDVGNEKNVVIEGKTYAFQIYDFNHDDKADGSGKAGITFGIKTAFSDQQQMNTTTTNQHGWDGSYLRGWLNGIPTINAGTTFAGGTNSVYAKIPDDLKNNIKTVKKYTSNGYYDQNIGVSLDKLFVFSEKEVLGVNTNSLNGEGTKYPIFNNSANYVKNLPNQTGDGWSWWFRSPRYNYDATQFLALNKYGTTAPIAIANESICFGFCV